MPFGGQKPIEAFTYLRRCTLFPSSHRNRSGQFWETEIQPSQGPTIDQYSSITSHSYYLIAVPDVPNLKTCCGRQRPFGTMESGEHANEASHLTAIPEIDFLIPRKPIQKSSGPSVGIHTPSPSDSKHESSQHGDLPRTTRRSIAQHFPRWLRDWWLETACCVVFTGALMAIVGAILPYQDQPLPQWPYNVSINTLISILIAISKAAMLLVTAEGISQLKWTWFLRKRPLQDMARYDMASRGPWGSLRLLLSLRGRDLVASVGAFVTVASIAIDPFAQVRRDV